MCRFLSLLCAGAVDVVIAIVTGAALFVDMHLWLFMFVLQLIILLVLILLVLLTVGECLGASGDFGCVSERVASCR